MEGIDISDVLVDVASAAAYAAAERVTLDVAIAEMLDDSARRRVMGTCAESRFFSSWVCKLNEAFAMTARYAEDDALRIAAEMCEGETAVCTTEDGKRVALNCAAHIENHRAARKRY